TELKRLPHFTLFMLIDKDEPESLSHSINSVRTQLYPHWELLIAAAKPQADKLAAIYEKMDARIKVVQCDDDCLYRTANRAIETAQGDFFAFIGQRDELTEHSLYLAAVELNRDPQADLIYSDEDCIDELEKLSRPQFKPDW